MHRRLACALLLSFGLGACRQADDTTLINGSGTVVVVQSSFVDSSDSRNAIGAGPVTYVIAKVEITNDQSAALVPAIARFALIDRTGERYFAVDSGASALAGISNDLSPIKPGEKRTLTIAFRAQSTTMGTIHYDY